MVSADKKITTGNADLFFCLADSFVTANKARRKIILKFIVFVKANNSLQNNKTVFFFWLDEIIC